MGDKRPSDTALVPLTFQGPLKISQRPLNCPKATCSVVFIPSLFALISPKVPLYTKNKRVSPYQVGGEARLGHSIHLGDVSLRLGFDVTLLPFSEADAGYALQKQDTPNRALELG